MNMQSTTSKGGAASSGGPSGSRGVPGEILDLATRIRATWPEGAALPAERKMADELGVNRYVLRRALQHLRDRGAIAPPRPRAPARKARPKPDDLVSMTNPLEVAELRRVIEPMFARLAAMRATPSDIAAMQKDVEAGGRDIHQLIAQSTGNTLAAELYGLLRRIEEDARLGSAAGSRADSPEDAERRRAIVDAIASRAPEKASAAMTETLSALYRSSLYGLD